MRARLGAVLGIVALACGIPTTEAGPPLEYTAPGVAALPCDPTRDHACIADGNGIFVDGINGVDGRSGTRAEPVRTISAALDMGARVLFVCATDYPERLRVSDSITLLGGLRCGDFAFTGERPQLHGFDWVHSLYLSDANVVAKAEPSSNAIAIRTWFGLTMLVRCSVTVEAGRDGKNGEITGRVPAASTLDGADANGAVPGGGGNGAKGCEYENFVGGKGGLPYQDGQGYGYSDIGAGLHVQCIQSGAPGGDGADGVDGKDYASGGDGTFGSSGKPGGGGGGGTTGAGGGGGGGGCAGRAATRGMPGGASVAIDGCTNLVLRETTISVGDGGRGGDGHLGEDGLAGGAPGLGSGDGCKGGRGGHGGRGGASAPGVGGISAILFNDGCLSPTSIDRDPASTLTLGNGGNGGSFPPPSTAKANDGKAGELVFVQGPPPP